MGSAMSDLEALWKNVVDNWDSDAAHATFLQHYQSTEQLAEAAARYAGMRGDRKRKKSAQKHLDTVAALTTSSLLTRRTERTKNIPKWFTVVVLMLFGAIKK